MSPDKFRAERIRRVQSVSGSTAARLTVTPAEVANAVKSAGACDCGDGFEQQVLQEAVTATYWFDPGERGKPYSVSIKFSGRRTDLVGKPQLGDYFTKVETVEGIVPGTGPVSITAKVSGVNAGEWLVRAEPIVRKGIANLLRPYPDSHQCGERNVKPMLWFWRKPAVSTGPPKPLKTGLAALAKAPGSIRGGWIAFVTGGVLLGLVVQAMLVARAHLEIGPVLAVSLFAVALGFVGAKAWYVALNLGKWRAAIIEGMCIQGFIAGAAVALLAAFTLYHMPVGTILDATTPGLFFGMAIGRNGCFFTGCCVGRATASRWGVWSTDRRLGTRRVPTQLFESLACLTIGVAALILILEHIPAVPGAVSVGALAVYTFFRQILFRFRAEPRKSPIAVPLSMGAAALVLIGDVIWSLVA